MAGRLYLDFCGEEHELSPEQALSFGREADLEIDDNPYMHRVVGCFESSDGHWWIHNRGTAIALNVFDHNSPTAALVAPGASAALTMADFGISFVAGRCRYEIDASLEDVADPAELVETPSSGERTLEWGMVELNHDQRLLLVDLAEHRLLHPSDRNPELPAKAACARRLGWSLSKYNRKLDHLCAKLDRAGVPGMYGEAGVQALDRRRRLVDHAVDFGLVSGSDLGVLEERVL